MHNASGKHLQAGLLALDADQSPSRSPRSEQWLMTEGKNVHHSGASASDSHRLPYAEIHHMKFSGLFAACRLCAR
jgi:hypothetical protein